MIVVGVAIPASISASPVRSSPSTITMPTTPSQGCSGSVTTITGTNGTHRAFSVTCTESGTGSEGLTVSFSPGAQSLASALSSSFTFLSIVSTIGVAFVSIVFQGIGSRKVGGAVLIPLVVALWVFSIAITLGVFYTLSPPLSGSPLSRAGVLVLVASTFWGLGLSIIALAGLIRANIN
jgi:hypothetical protein